ncbi:histidinol-phosphate transaminase [Pontibacter sp. JAM-7]|uniref:histidinol-phosphate transaminase n=1 Tax=Pontibacter sp. JAM-7 TaxID=3366581 RepID=UPI003AF9605E
MSKYWSDAIRNLVPYVPGEQPKLGGITKLNTNENPFPPSPAVNQVLQQFDTDRLRLYPDPDCSKLKQALADYYNLNTAQVFVGNGSDEVLAHTFMAFFRQPKPLLMPEFTYSFYQVYCNLYDIDAHLIPLQEKFAIDLDDYSIENGGIIFANPNAPTSRALSLDKIEQLLQRNTETVVVVDEAYVDFGAESAVSLINRYPNLLVVQTFSKSRSLAGMRVGYAMGDAELINGLERVKNSFNSYPLDMLALDTAIAALQDESYFTATTAEIIATREWTTAELAKLGFDSLPSKTNFLFTSHATTPAAVLMSYLREANILVRYFNKPGIDNYLRITVGTRQEMELLIATLQQCPRLQT